MTAKSRQNRRRGGARKPGRKSGRKFRRATTGNASSKTQVVGVSYMPPQIRNTTQLARMFRATEYLSTVTITTNAGPPLSPPSGTVLLETDINPAQWTSTRAYEEAGLWGYYRFRRCVFHFEPSAPTSYGGQIAIGTDTSVDTPIGGSTGIQNALGYILALPGAKTAPVWAGFSIPFDCRPGHRPFSWFQTALTGLEGLGTVTGSQGRILMCLSQAINNVTASTPISWTVRVEYAIEFSRPQLSFPTGTIYQSTPTVNSIINIGANGLLNQGYGIPAGNVGDVLMLAPPPETAVAPTSPPARYLVNTGASTYFAWSTYPNEASKGDVVGTNTNFVVQSNFYAVYLATI
jgi:hypothetical protein